MFDLPDNLGRSRKSPLRVVAIGAHADDLEIGCAATVMRLCEERPHLMMRWVVLAGEGERGAEAQTSADDFLRGVPALRVSLKRFPDGRFPEAWPELKGYFSQRLQPFEPHLVLTHRLEDAHQDHRAAAELSWQTFRGATIAGYEIPKWDGDLGRPNVYISSSPRLVDRKLSLLRTHFETQHEKKWYDEETFKGLLRLRGIEAGTTYAEAFECHKLVW